MVVLMNCGLELNKLFNKYDKYLWAITEISLGDNGKEKRTEHFNKY